MLLMREGDWSEVPQIKLIETGFNSPGERG